jgi:hypothetical protein
MIHKADNENWNNGPQYFTISFINCPSLSAILMKKMQSSEFMNIIITAGTSTGSLFYCNKEFLSQEKWNDEVL